MTSLALEKRQYIESNKRRLSAEQTSDSDTVLSGSTHVPYVIRFKGMPTQTFGEKTGGCSKQVNYLIQPEEK